MLCPPTSIEEMITLGETRIIILNCNLIMDIPLLDGSIPEEITMFRLPL